ncbi:MAG: hypothetical protein II124_04610 [Clostridia bacterium]|nr:hypothetical protein [Clostridia bacterium]MBQ2518336.1 hypothetical protein [Clostridia bacterium]MBQ4341683.1 hypothetical protein [Clostridia bacterium]MBR6428062.1 hypothetical protein [Clostridia bacterium]
MEGAIKLVVVTPEGEAGRAFCDSVTFCAMDNEKGEGGGSVGILKGHLPLIAALEDGSRVTAKRSGSEVFSAEVWGAFAYAADDTVTVITRSRNTEAPAEKG